MRYIFLLCFLCWFSTASAQNYNFVRNECTLEIKRPSGTITQSLNLFDLKWRETKPNRALEVNDYSNSFALRDGQINNFADIDALIAQLVIWKDSCLTDVGVSIDANTSNGISGDGTVATPVKLGGTLSENTTVADGGKNLTVSGSGIHSISSNVGTNWTGGLLNSSNVLGFGIKGYGILGQNATSSLYGWNLFGDFTTVGDTDHTWKRGLGDITGVGSLFNNQATYNTVSDNLTANYQISTKGAGISSMTFRSDADGTGDAILQVYAKGNATGNQRTDIGVMIGSTREKAIRFRENFWAVSDTVLGVPGTFQYKHPYTSADANGQFLTFDGTDSTMDWTYTSGKVNQVNITGTSVTLADFTGGNVLRINTATLNDTLYLPAGAHDAMEVVVSNRSGVAVQYSSSANINGSSQVIQIGANGLTYLRWSATEPEWLVGQ